MINSIIWNVESDDPFVCEVVRRAVTIERQGGGASRDVADAYGKKWRVREMEMAEEDGSAARKSLIALNEMVIRRFWSFPAGWRELSDPALLALIDGPAQPHPEARPESE
ncbi:MAG TPA: hypothetical protein VII66_09235 [Gemmatimonadaceae bacterium]